MPKMRPYGRTIPRERVADFKLRLTEPSAHRPSLLGGLLLPVFVTCHDVAENGVVNRRELLGGKFDGRQVRREHVERKLFHLRLPLVADGIIKAASRLFNLFIALILQFDQVADDGVPRLVGGARRVGFENNLFSLLFDFSLLFVLLPGADQARQRHQNESAANDADSSHGETPVHPENPIRP